MKLVTCCTICENRKNTVYMLKYHTGYVHSSKRPDGIDRLPIPENNIKSLFMIFHNEIVKLYKTIESPVEGIIKFFSKDFRSSFIRQIEIHYLASLVQIT